jgi:membrane-associated phospholipid phosphatase
MNIKRIRPVLMIVGMLVVVHIAAAIPGIGQRLIPQRNHRLADYIQFDPMHRASYQLIGIGATASWLAWKMENQALASKTLASWAGDISKFGNTWGDGRTSLALAGLLHVSSKMLSSPELLLASQDLTKSFLLSGTSINIIKFAFRRKRPDGGPRSFPSGHTGTAFAMAPIIHKHFGTVPGLISYGLAFATGIGRVHHNRHYVSDVIFGATLGYWAGKLVLGESIPFLESAVIGFSGKGLKVAIKF